MISLCNAYTCLVLEVARAEYRPRETLCQKIRTTPGKNPLIVAENSTCPAGYRRVSEILESADVTSCLFNRIAAGS